MYFFYCTFTCLLLHIEYMSNSCHSFSLSCRRCNDCKVMFHIHFMINFNNYKFSLLYFYTLTIKDLEVVADSFCPVCHSVILSETLTLLIIFQAWVLEPDILLDYSLWLDLSVGIIKFDFVTLTNLENFNMLIFWAVSFRALIDISHEYTCISCELTCPWVLTFFTVCPWPWSLT